MNEELKEKGFITIAGRVSGKYYSKISGYVVIYRSKDKNTTQGNLAELVGSPVAPAWCK